MAGVVVTLRTAHRERSTSSLPRFARRTGLLGRGVKYRLVFRFLVIVDEPEAPPNERRKIFGFSLLLVQEFFNTGFQLRLLRRRVDDLENFHRQQPVFWMFGLLGLPNLAEPLIAGFAFADFAHLLVQVLQALSF